MSNVTSITGKRVLVTGASGFIGKQVCIRLKQLGSEIYAVSKKKRKNADLVHQWLTGDLTDFDFTMTTIGSIKPEVIFHLAGFTTGERELKAVLPTYHNNLTATINILTAATDAGIPRLVHAGSLEEPDEIQDEDIIPVSPYAASKWACTIYARMFHKLYGTPVTVARIFMVYGPGDQDFRKLVPYVIRSLLLKKKPKLTSGTRVIDWIYIDDVVSALIQLAVTDGIEGKSIDLGSGTLFSIRDICGHIKRIMDSDIPIGFGEIADRKFERIQVADLKNMSKYLDWKPEVDIEEGLKRTVSWLNSTLS